MDRVKLVIRVMLIGIFVLFLYGWSNRATLQDNIAKCETIKQSVKSASEYVQNTAQTASRFGFSREWIEAHGSGVDLVSIVEYSINKFMIDGKGGNEVSFPNPYASSTGSFTIAAKGEELGKVYIDTSHVGQDGLLDIVGIYRNPSNGHPLECKETVNFNAYLYEMRQPLTDNQTSCY